MFVSNTSNSRCVAVLRFFYRNCDKFFTPPHPLRDMHRHKHIHKLIFSYISTRTKLVIYSYIYKLRRQIHLLWFMSLMVVELTIYRQVHNIATTLIVVVGQPPPYFTWWWRSPLKGLAYFLMQLKVHAKCSLNFVLQLAGLGRKL